MNAPILQLDGDAKLRYIRDHALAACDQIQVTTLEEAIDKLMSGFAVLAVDGCDFMIAFGVQGFTFRGIQEPATEKSPEGLPRRVCGTTANQHFHDSPPDEKPGADL